MSPAEWVTVAFLLTLTVTAVLTSQLAIERRRARNAERLLSEMQSEVTEAEERADYWKRRFEAQGYREPHFETPEQFHQRQAMERQFAEHTADALAVAESPVVPLRPRGGA